MLRLLLFVALASCACPSLAGACVWLPGTVPTDSERRHWSRVQTADRQVQAARRLKSEQVAVADELAELLVPNIRPVQLTFTDCGPEGEIDFAGGISTPQELTGILSADPRLKDVDVSAYAGIIRRSAGDIVSGPNCNGEFRRRFAEWLANTMSRTDLESAWLFLVSRKRETNSRGSVYGRLIRFSGDTRRPPVLWWGTDQWIDKDINRFVRRDRVGNALDRTMTTFWGQYADSLDRDDLVCPVAATASAADRTRVIDMILRERDARRSRAKALTPPPADPAQRR